MQAPSPSGLVLLLVVPLVLWRIHARIRRLVGRQRLSRVRPWVTLVLFPALVALLALAAHAQPQRLLWLAAGLAVGALLGRYGLKRTRFEATPGGLFYTPNAHLGIALSLLLVGRVAYRLFEVYALGLAAPDDLSGFAASMLTLALFGVLAGYYVSYAIGLVRWRHSVMTRPQ